MITNEKAREIVNGVLNDKLMVGDFNYFETSPTFKEFLDVLQEDSSYREAIPSIMIDAIEHTIVINRMLESETFKFKSIEEVIAASLICVKLGESKENEK